MNLKITKFFVVIVLLLSLVFFVSSLIFAEESVKLGIGVLKYCTTMQGFTYGNREWKVIQQVGKDLGVKIEPVYHTFDYASDALLAMRAGEVQIATVATFPLAAQLILDKPIVPLGILSQVGIDFQMMVEEGGPIKDFDDLKGATVGMPIGAAQQFVFELFIRQHFGKSPKELGITIMNFPQLVSRMPKGLDAYIGFVPGVLPFINDKDSNVAALFGTRGYTGKAYDGKLGTGAGILIPSISKKSPTWPEGLNAHRHWWVADKKFFEDHPDVVKAFIIANNKIMQKESKMKVREITNMFPDNYFDVMPRDLYEELGYATEGIYQRGWTWATEAAIKALMYDADGMKALGIVDEPLTNEKIKKAFEPVIPLLKDAYDQLKYPSMDEFLRKDVQDFRGIPLWEIENWNDIERFKIPF